MARRDLRQILRTVCVNSAPAGDSWMDEIDNRLVCCGEVVGSDSVGAMTVGRPIRF